MRWNELTRWIRNRARSAEELRQACQGLNLETAGNTVELRQRLEEYVAAQDQDADAPWDPQQSAQQATPQQPAPHRRWPWVLAAALILLLCVGAGGYLAWQQGWVRASVNPPMQVVWTTEPTKPLAVVGQVAKTTVPQAETKEVEATQQSEGSNSACPDRAIRTEPQGLLQPDGSFVAQFGTSGCRTIFEGRIWEAGLNIQPRHDIVLIEGAQDGFRYWEGNGWLLPSEWDAKQIACQLWENKKENWLSQGITPLPLRFWGFGTDFVCPSAQAVATATPVPTRTPAPTAAAPTATPAITPALWASLLGVPEDRLEQCPGEDVNACVHIMDGDLVSVQIPENYQFEGWDGSQTLGGEGPATVQAVGLTVRPTS